jgi:hypothetical protein
MVIGKYNIAPASLAFVGVGRVSATKDFCVFILFSRFEDFSRGMAVTCNLGKADSGSLLNSQRLQQLFQ